MPSSGKEDHIHKINLKKERENGAVFIKGRSREGNRKTGHG